MKHLRTTAVLLGLAVYAVAFYATPLPDVRNDAGRPLLRIELITQLLLLPDKLLATNWFGTPAGFSLFDRLPVLLAATVILVWATVLGWLVIFGVRRFIAAFFAPDKEQESRSIESREAAEICYTTEQKAAMNRRTPNLDSLETAVFSAAVGLSMLSTWVLLLGLFGVMDRLGMFVLPSLATLLAAGYVWWNSRGLTARGKCSPSQPLSRRLLAAGYSDTLSLHWLWLGAPFVLMIFLAGMLPPLDFDVREYHLQAPKEFFQQGQITFLPHNVYANMTLGTEMLSLLAMVITGDWWLGALAGKTVIAAFTPLTALALVAAGRRFFTPTAGIVAALVYISVPWVVSIASGGFVEGASACYLFLAVYALLLLQEQGRAGGLPHEESATSAQPGLLLALAGYLAGAAVATKYPAVLFVLVPLGVWVVFEFRFRVACPRLPWACFPANSHAHGKRGHATLPSTKSGDESPHSKDAERRTCHPNASRFYTSLEPLAVFLLAATIACGLWFGKNWVLTGNPTYPLLYEVFDGKSWTAEKEQQWNRVHRPHDFSAETLGKDLGRVTLTSEWLSPLVVPLAVLAFFGCASSLLKKGDFDFGCHAHACRGHVNSPENMPTASVGMAPILFQQTARRSKIVWALLAYAGFVIATWWLFTHRIDRFWIPVLPVLALLAGMGACWNSDRWWRWVLSGLLVAGLGANFLVASMGPGNAWFVRLAQLRNAPGWIDPWHQFFNAHAADGRVLTVGDAAVFDLKPPVLYNTCFDDCIFEQLVKGRTTAEIRAELATRQIAFVYVQWGEIDRYRATYGFTDFVQPEVFDRLVAEGVLEPLPPIQDHPGRAYRVNQVSR